MLVTITQYTELARDANGNVLPLGGAGSRLGCIVADAAEELDPLDAQTRFVRLTTDTAIQIDIAGGATPADGELFMPGTEHFAVQGGETFTIGAVA
jgi:hypothetical protein